MYCQPDRKFGVESYASIQELETSNSKYEYMAKKSFRKHWRARQCHKL